MATNRFATTAVSQGSTSGFGRMATLAVRNANSADITNSEVSREQFQYYLDNFVPVERAAAGQIRNPAEIEARANNAGIEAREAYAGTGDEFRRNTGRFGIALDASQMGEAQGAIARGQAGAEAGAQTRARSGLYDQNLVNQGEFVRLGRNLASTSQDALGLSASLEKQRNATNRNIKAQEDASTMQLAGSVLTTAAMIYFCSRDYKENIRPVDPNQAAAMLAALEVVEHDYRADAPAQGHCLSVLVEDVPEALRNGDKQLNTLSVIGMLIATNQALLKRVAALESRNA